jgi:hypothetical protein
VTKDPVSDERPPRTIYRSAAGAAAAAPAADPSAKTRRRLRDAWWPAPVLALVVLLAAFALASFFLLGGFGLLQYFGVTASGQKFAGTWGSSDTALGAPVVRITKVGGAYTIAGVRVLGRPAVAAQVNDDALVATGAAGSGVSWRLSLSFVDRDQLRARLTYGDGRPPLETLLTRQ